jgi:hypothetical protein
MFNEKQENIFDCVLHHLRFVLKENQDEYANVNHKERNITVFRTRPITRVKQHCFVITWMSGLHNISPILR